MDHSSTTFLRLRVIEDRSYPGIIWFYANGLIEVVFNVPHSTTSGGEIVLGVLDIFESVSHLARAVRNGFLAELFSYGSRRRVDWFVNVSSTVSVDRGPQHWAGLEFPGREPGSHTGQRPFTPVTGLVPGKIHGLSPRAGREHLEEHIIKGFLEDNGYDDTVWAIADILEALETNPSR